MLCVSIYIHSLKLHTIYIHIVLIVASLLSFFISKMKRDKSSNFYYCYYKGLVEKNAVEDGESSKKPRIGVLTRRQAQREVSRPCCVVCEAMEKNLLMENVEKKKEEVMKSTGEVDKEEKGDERGKEVVDYGEKNGGENNGDGGVVVKNVLEEEKNNNNNVNLMSSENFGKCDLFDWGEWNYERDQIWNEWTCSYPFFWESEYGAYYYWDVLANETAAKEWVECLWQD